MVDHCWLESAGVFGKVDKKSLRNVFFSRDLIYELGIPGRHSFSDSNSIRDNYLDVPLEVRING